MFSVCFSKYSRLSLSFLNTATETTVETKIDSVTQFCEVATSTKILLFFVTIEESLFSYKTRFYLETTFGPRTKLSFYTISSHKIATFLFPESK